MSDSTLTRTPTAYRVTFERIGRRHDLAPQDFTASDAQDLSEQVWRFANGYLGSKWFEVDVDLEAMRGTIEMGRFGRFTVEVAP